jgi:hypothetical protein
MDNLKDLESMHVIVAEFRKITLNNRETLLRILDKEHNLIGDKLDQPFAEAKRRWIEGGRRDKIAAIKEVRTIAGFDADKNCILGLKEAKDLVESW